MAYYSKQQLQQRDNIIKSQLLFGNFLNRDIINALIHLFDKETNSYVSPMPLKTANELLEKLLEADL